MTTAQPSEPMATWLFRGCQGALALIVLVYALILLLLAQGGFFIDTAAAFELVGYLFFIYLAPGTFALLFATFLWLTGKRPGPVFAKLSLFAGFWTIVAGYNVVLT